MLWVLHIVYRFESIFEFIWSGVSWLNKAWSTNILNRSLLSSINLVSKDFIGIWIVRANFQIVVILTLQSLVLSLFTVGCLINNADEVTKKISLAHCQLTLSTIHVPSIRRIIVWWRRHPAEDSFLLLWILCCSQIGGSWPILVLYNWRDLILTRLFDNVHVDHFIIELIQQIVLEGRFILKNVIMFGLNCFAEYFARSIDGPRQSWYLWFIKVVICKEAVTCEGPINSNLPVLTMAGLRV